MQRLRALKNAILIINNLILSWSTSGPVATVEEKLHATMGFVRAAEKENPRRIRKHVQRYSHLHNDGARCSLSDIRLCRNGRIIASTLGEVCRSEASLGTHPKLSYGDGSLQMVSFGQHNYNTDHHSWTLTLEGMREAILQSSDSSPNGIH